MIFYKLALKTVFLDDDSLYLETLKEIFSQNDKLYSYFQNVEELESFLEVDFDNKSAIENLVSKLQADMDIFSFSKNLYECINCHNFVSVLVIDYSLAHEKTGLDILQNLKCKRIFKILNTAVADEEIAIEAFHAGLVNRYFKKTQTVEKLIEHIKTGNDMFFKDVSDFIATQVKNANDNSALNDKEYLSFVQSLVSSNNIKSYFLLDSQGSFLLIDQKGESHCVFVMQADTIASQIEVLEEHGLDTVANEVLKRKKLLYQNNSCEIGAKELIFPVNALTENPKFLVSYVKANIFEHQRNVLKCLIYRSRTMNVR